MIVDKISNLKQYNILENYVDKIIEFIEYVKKTEVYEGRHDILGDELFALVQKYNTKDIADCFPESHEKYIDLQYILKGKENLIWNFTNELEIEEDKRPDADIMFYKKSDILGTIRLEKDMFALLFPNDAHTPCIKINNSSQVFKIVFKIKIPFIENEK